MLSALMGQRGGLPAVALVCGLLMASGGCSSPGEVSAGARAVSPGEAPAFSGPWAAEFTENFARTTTDFERDVLADEVVTDQELAETRDRFTQCLTSFGFTAITYEPNGGFSFNIPDGHDSPAVDDQVSGCSDESGEATVGALHSWVRRNPENLDEDTILAACLVRKEVVDPSFSAADYAAADGDIPFVESVTPSLGEATFLTCNADPLGLFD